MSTARPLPAKLRGQKHASARSVEFVTIANAASGYIPARQMLGTAMKTAFHVLFSLALVLGLASSVLANVH